MELKIYFQHGGTSEEYMKKYIRESGLKRKIKTNVLINDDCELYDSRGIDLYLLHFSEIPEESIKELRRKNSKSLIYAIFGGGYEMPKNEKEVYDGVFTLRELGDNDCWEIFKTFIYQKEASA